MVVTIALCGRRICHTSYLLDFYAKRAHLRLSIMEQQSESSTPSTRHHVWTPAEDALLVECLKELLAEGKFLADNNFKAGHLKTMEVMLKAKSPGCGIKGVPHIQSRLKTLKASWKVVYDIVYGANTFGFGWDPKNKCVTAKQAVWDEYIKSKKKIASFRNKPFPHFEELCMVWGKDRAMGKDAQSVCDIVEELRRSNTEVGNEETTELEPDVQDDLDFSEPLHEHEVGASSPSRKRKSSSIDHDDRFIEVLGEVARRMDGTITAVTDRLCNSVDRPARDAEMDAMAERLYFELLKVEGLTEDEVYHAHIKLATSDRLMVLFKSIPCANKAAWLRCLIE